MTRGTIGRRVFVAAAVLLAVSACSPESAAPDASPSSTATPRSTVASPSETAPAAAVSPVPDPTPTSPESPSPGSSPTPAPSTPEPTPTEVGPPAWEELATGFDPLVATLVDPRTSDLLVVELPGRIRALDGTVLLDLSDRVTVGSEQGLLDATPTPDGTGLVVHYSGAGGQTVLSVFPVADDPGEPLASAADETVLLTFDQPAGNHNGGSVVFGADGWLYFALGDGGLANDAFGNGADPATPLGAILRLDVTSDPGVAAPAPDNPFLDGGGDPRVWAHGLRNPWRITTDGARWFVADVGQDAVEEVTIVPADAGETGTGWDLGWPDWEGDFCRVDVCEEDSLPPVATLTQTDGACSILGGAVASRPTIDAGQYLYTDLCDTRVWRLDPTSGEVVADAPLPDGTRPLALDVDADGAVVALTQDGRVLLRTRS